MNAVKMNGFQHMGLPVADMDASVTWYRDVLGFKVTSEHVIEDNGPVRIVFLERAGFVVEMFESADAREAIRKPAGYQIIAHLCFDVDSISETETWLKERGIPTIEAAPRGLPLLEKGVRFLNVLGPNREQIEFNEVLR